MDCCFPAGKKKYMTDDTETIHITKIVNGGYGFARLATGQVALVRQVLPDETVIITIEEAKKNYLFGKVQQILKPNIRQGYRLPANIMASAGAAIYSIATMLPN